MTVEHYCPRCDSLWECDLKPSPCGMSIRAVCPGCERKRTQLAEVAVEDRWATRKDLQ